MPQPSRLQHHDGDALFGTDTTAGGTHPPARAPMRLWNTTGWVGAEYTPSLASNSLWWADYDLYEPAINHELAAARARLGFTALRMFVHYEVSVKSLPTRSLRATCSFSVAIERAGASVAIDRAGAYLMVQSLVLHVA